MKTKKNTTNWKYKIIHTQHWNNNTEVILSQHKSLIEAERSLIANKKQEERQCRRLRAKSQDSFRIEKI